MTRKLLALCAFVLVLGVSEASAFCYDKTDNLIVKLKKLNLNTEQLKDIFEYQQDHKDLIVQSHSDGRGCRYHEKMEVEFEKASIGVLTDEQFEKYAGRERTETEALRYENYLLKKELARLERVSGQRQRLAAVPHHHRDRRPEAQELLDRASRESAKELKASCSM